MSEMPTAETKDAWVLGDRVRVNHRLVRRSDARHHKAWVAEELPEEVEGLVVGVRTLSNGTRTWETADDFGGDAGYWEYTPDAYFRAVLVATDLRRRPFLALYATKLDG